MQAATPNIYLFFLLQRLLRLQDLHFGQLIAHLLSRRLLRGEGNADLAIVEKKIFPSVDMTATTRLSISLDHSLFFTWLDVMGKMNQAAFSTSLHHHHLKIVGNFFLWLYITNVSAGLYRPRHSCGNVFCMHMPHNWTHAVFGSDLPVLEGACEGFRFVAPLVGGASCCARGCLRREGARCLPVPGGEMRG